MKHLKSMPWLATIIICLCAYSAPVNAGLIKKDLSLNNSFTGVYNSTMADIIYVQSDNVKISVEGESELVDNLIYEVKNNVLNFRMTKLPFMDRLKSSRPFNAKFVITIHAPQIDLVKIAGSGTFIDKEGHKTIHGFVVNVAGSGNAEFNNLECGDIVSSVTGSGNIVFHKLKCGHSNYSVSGSGDIAVNSSVTDGNSIFKVTGSGTIKGNFSISGDVEAIATGSGDITINGKCRNVICTISGSGNIHGKLTHKDLSQKVSGSGRVNF